MKDKSSEAQRLAAEVNTTLRKLAALDPIVGGLAIHIEHELRGMGYEPPPEPYAGPEGPPPVPPSK